VTIPAGATVNKAWIQFGASKKNSQSCNLNIFGEYSGNSAAFTTASGNVSSRTKTAAAIGWNPPSWTKVGDVSAAQKTPDLKTVVQEILGHSSWTSGNSMTFIITGSGTRDAYAYEGNALKSAQLVVEYTAPTGLKAGKIAEGSGDIQGIPGKGKLICYPVPFRDELNIQFTPVEGEVMESLEIFSSSGVLMKKIMGSSNYYQLKINDLAPGMYLIRCRSNRNIYAEVVIRE